MRKAYNRLKIYKTYIAEVENRATKTRHHNEKSTTGYSVDDDELSGSVCYPATNRE